MQAYETTPLESTLFLLSSGGYSSIITIVLIAIIMVLAISRRIYSLIYIFSGLLILIGALTILNMMTLDNNQHIVMTLTRHTGRIINVIPFLIIIWMIKNSANQKDISQTDQTNNAQGQPAL